MRFHNEKQHITLTVGESVRIARELQELTQAELAAMAGLSQPTLSGIEKGRVALGVDRAKRLARALKVHPAVLLFPSWIVDDAGEPRGKKRAARAA